MAEDGFVGAYNGSQAREVLLTVEQWEEMSGQKGAGGGAAVPASPPPAKARSNKIVPTRDDEDVEPDYEVDDVDETDADDEESTDDDDLDDEAAERDESDVDWDGDQDDDAEDEYRHRTA
jgi:hypothetical protein